PAAVDGAAGSEQPCENSVADSTTLPKPYPLGVDLLNRSFGRTLPTKADQSRKPARTSEDRLRALYAEHAGPLLGYALRLLHGDRSAAEDVVQETLLRAWTHPEAMDPSRGSPRNWLFTVARNLVIDAIRARKTRPAEVGEGRLGGDWAKSWPCSPRSTGPSWLKPITMERRSRRPRRRSAYLRGP